MNLSVEASLTANRRVVDFIETFTPIGPNLVLLRAPLTAQDIAEAQAWGSGTGFVVAELKVGVRDAVSLVEEARSWWAAGADALLLVLDDRVGSGPRPTMANLAPVIDLLAREVDSPLGVVAYPYGHPDSPNLRTDLEYLGEQIAAGASFAITEVFFDPDAYLYMMDRASRLQVEIPITPGIAPITARSQMKNWVRRSGSALPDALTARLNQAGGDNDALREVGIAWAIDLLEQMFDIGVPGVHFYSLIDPNACLDTCLMLGLSGASGIRKTIR